MKKAIIVAALGMVLAFALCACGQQEASSSAAASDASASAASSAASSAAASTSATSASSAASTTQSAAASSKATAAPQVLQGKFATMQDVFDVSAEDAEMTIYYGRFIMAFADGDAYYRVVVDLPEGMEDELSSTLASSDEFEELLAPLSVTKTELIYRPTQDELDKYRGKTGADLAAAGFTFYTFAVSGNETDCNAKMGSFDYVVTFEGEIEDRNTDDVTNAVKDMKVKDIGIKCMSWDALIAE